MTFGLGLSVLSTSFTKNTIKAATQKQVQQINDTYISSAQTSVQPHIPPGEGYRPPYSGFGFHPAGATLDAGVRVPGVNNIGRTR